MLIWGSPCKNSNYTYQSWNTKVIITEIDVKSVMRKKPKSVEFENEEENDGSLDNEIDPQMCLPFLHES